MRDFFKNCTIPETLKNRLWNIVSLFIETEWVEKEYNYFSQKEEPTQFMDDLFILKISNYLWIDKDSLPTYLSEFKKYIKCNFIWTNDWNIFRLVKFFYKNIPSEDINSRRILMNKINDLLQTENYEYRLNESWDFLKITNKEEMESIDEAEKTRYWNVNKHIESARRLLNNSDYRNSIKESLSAVEAICCNIVWDEKATLWEAIKKLKQKWIHIHPALEQWFDKIYWYVSDDWWIRHKLKQNFEEPTYDDAKYRLVSCSAFVSYLNSKA